MAQKIAEAENIGELRSTHAAYLARAVQQCFLDPKAKFIHEAILKVLSVALQLRSVSHSRCCPSPLTSTDDVFGTAPGTKLRI